MKTEEKAEHTKGKLSYNGIVSLTDEDSRLIATVWLRDKYINQPDCVEYKANAHRLKASWNACEGIPTKALEKGVVGEMREALEAVLEIPYSDIRTETEIYGKVRAALAKLKGE